MSSPDPFPRSRPATDVHSLGPNLVTSDVITTSLMDIAERLVSQAWRQDDPDAYRAGVADACEAARRRLTAEVTLSVDELLDVLRHELTTPLFVVGSAAETLLLRRNGLGEDDVAAFLDMVHRNSVLLKALVESIPRNGETAGTFRVSPEPVDLAKLLRAAVVDPQAVRRILNALLTNAAKFSPPSTPIRITLRLPDGWLVVCVTDTGPGIAPDDREAVFEKFRRFDPTIGGSGLGLYLARGLARQHGGDLIVGDAGSEGEGAMLVLRLPRTPAAAA